MADWIEIYSERYLSVNKMNAIQNNIKFIKERLEELEYPFFSLPNLVKCHYDDSPYFIREKLNQIEEILKILEENTDWINPNNFDFLWERITYNKKKAVDRWIDYLNFAYGVLNGSIGGPQYLIDSNGNYIVDQNGNYILVYKEF